MMQIIKKTAFLLYPIGIAILIPFLTAHESKAGVIRQALIPEDKPAIVTLAFGHATAISFFVRPEKIVAGAPNKLQIDFLGKDINITPLASNPGNLLVYTKTSRFVIHLRIGTESSYDDVVELLQGKPGQVRAIRLLEDSFKLTHIKIVDTTKGTSEKEVPVLISTDQKRIEGNELLATLNAYKAPHCDGCKIVNGKGLIKISCATPVQSVSCKSKSGSFVIKRGDP